MMGRTTLREVKEALAAARQGEATPLATPLAAELESLAQSLKGEAGDAPAERALVEAPAEEPNKALQQTGGS